MVARLIEKGKQCGFGLKDGCCGKPAIASIGGTPLCLGCFEYSSSLMQVECVAGSPKELPASKGTKATAVSLREFTRLAREWDAMWFDPEAVARGRPRQYQ